MSAAYLLRDELGHRREPARQRLGDDLTQAALEVPRREAMGVLRDDVGGRVEPQHTLDRVDDALDLLGAEERGGDAVLAGLDRAAGAERDDRLAGRLRLHRRDAEVLAPGEHQG